MFLFFVEVQVEMSDIIAIISLVKFSKIEINNYSFALLIL